MAAHAYSAYSAVRRVAAARVHGAGPAAALSDEQQRLELCDAARFEPFILRGRSAQEFFTSPQSLRQLVLDVAQVIQSLGSQLPTDATTQLPETD